MSWSRRNYDRSHNYRLLAQLAALPATIREPEERPALRLFDPRDMRLRLLLAQDADYLRSMEDRP